MLLSLVLLVFSSLLMFILWLDQRKTQNAGIVDAGWALCLMMGAILYSTKASGCILRRELVLLTGGIWAARLAFHIYFDRVAGKREDGRYAHLRTLWGEKVNSKMFLFFQAQALAAVLFSLPWLLLANGDNREFRLIDSIGLAVFICALFGEMIADRQLARFRAELTNKGRTCDSGLWRYSRHPNYFFEWLHWWSYVLLTYGQPYWEYTIIAPVTMLILLLKYTGIPYSELQAIRSRGENYRRYQRVTSMFIPWFPKAAE